MYCVKCGAKIENEDAKFCPKCGAEIGQTTVEVKTEPKVEAPKTKSVKQQSKATEPDKKEVKSEETKPKKKKSMKKKVLVFFIILILAVLVAGGVILKNKFAKKETVKQTEVEAIKEDATKEKSTNDTEKDESESEPVATGTNQSDSIAIPLGTKVFGTLEPKASVWYSFTTGETEGATYNVTYVNGTAETDRDIVGQVYDEYGEVVVDTYEKWASSNGKPVTLFGDELEPNTTYFVKLFSDEVDLKLEYSLIVKDPDKTYSAYKTVGHFSDAGGTSNELENQLVAGTNQGVATFLDLDTQVLGTLEPKASAWFSFTTGETEGATYNVTYVNCTAETDRDIIGYVYDEYGEEAVDTYEKWAHSDGKPVTLFGNELKPSTTYYVRLYSDETKLDLKYTLNVKSPEEKKSEKAALVFEVPFEINETQVQFTPNEATFVDEAKANEAVKPVAEAVLNAPDHAILIAGTTATDGTQESCVELSNKRAEAVKKLLVDTYKVPESQIKTVGLGYEVDPFERGADRDANGDFVESEAKKNRRVVILDVDDAIAQQLLTN